MNKLWNIKKQDSKTSHVGKKVHLIGGVYHKITVQKEPTEKKQRESVMLLIVLWYYEWMVDMLIDHIPNSRSWKCVSKHKICW